MDKEQIQSQINYLKSQPNGAATHASRIAALENQLASAQSQQGQQQSSGSALDTIKSIFSFDFGGFFGTIFSGLLWVGVLTGVYFAARGPLREFVDNIFGKENTEKFFGWADGLIEGFKAMVGMDHDLTPILLKESADGVVKELSDKMGVEADTLKKYIGTKESKDALVNFIAATNGGKIRKEQLTGPDTIYALMTSNQYAPLLMDIAKASLAKAGQGQKLEGESLKVLNSLRAIVGDEERLNALLTTHRARTLNILKTALKPDAAATLEKLIDDGMEGGKATPALRALLTSMLTPDSEGKLPGEPAIKKAVETYGKENPKAAVTLLDAFLATDEGRTFAGNKNGEAFTALQRHMGDKTSLATLLMTYKNLGNNKLAQMKFALDNRPAFDAYVENADLESLPAAYRTPLEHLKMVPKEATATIAGILGRGIDPLPLRALVSSEGPMTASHLVNVLLTSAPQRALIREIGADDVVKVAAAFAKEKNANLPAIVTPQNLNAALKAADAIAASKTMADEAGKRDSRLVVNAFVDMLMNENPAALSKLKAAELAKFMNEPANSNALKTLLQEVSGLSKQQDATRQVLIKHWDVISRLGADEKDGAGFLIDAINRASDSKKDAYSCMYPNQLDATTRGYIAWKGTSLFSENLVGKYAEEFKKLAIDLKGIACDNLPPIVPPRAAGQASAPTR